MNRVIKIDNESIYFENGFRLYSYHESDCCEWHELTLSDLSLNDFEGLEFDFRNDNFFKRIKDYGIELIPVYGHSIKIAGHYSNNGCYSDKLDLILERYGKIINSYDITECQNENS